MDLVVLQLAYLAAIALGAWIRILAPFIRKTLAGEHLEYDHLYTLLFLVSFVMSLLVSGFVYLENPFNPGGPLLDLLLKGFIGGFSAQAIINELAKWFFPESWWKT